MNIERGLIWEDVQLDIAEAIPEGAETDLSRCLTFFDWREHGGYHVSGATKLDFFIDCSSREYGSMIAREVSSLSAQALEHRVLLAQAASAGMVCSPSWLLVTSYYWCVFLVLAWLRLVGKIIAYVPSNEIARLKQLGPRDSKTPSNGTFLLTSTDRVGARSNLRLRRLKTNNFHEGLWNAFAEDIKERLNITKKSPANWETRLFAALDTTGFADGASWLSKLRNIVNYRVGFGYKASEGSPLPFRENPLQLAKSATPQTLITEIENLQLAIAARRVTECPNEYAKLLVLFGSLTTHMLEDHRKEVWTRRKFDLSILQAGHYLKQFGATSTTLWPL